MPEYGEIVAVPNHHLTIHGNQDVWSCACGADGRGDSDMDVYEVATAHRDDAVKTIAPTLAPAQFAEALHRGANDSSQDAAVCLLAWHDHWMGYGYLRQHPFVSGQWDSHGNLALRLAWHDIAAAVGHARELVDALDDRDAPYDAIRSLRTWADENGPARQRIHGSTSELAILKVACSIAGRYPVNLGPDLSGLDNTNRGLVITAISHLLNYGGGLPMRSALSWSAYGERYGKPRS